MKLVLGSLLGLPHDSNIYQTVMTLTALVVILVGLRALFQPLIMRYGYDDSDATHGSTRFATDAESTGKGVGTIIPNLLTYPGSVICIDPKGENARVTARRHGQFGPDHVLAPFGVTGQPSAAFNPLDRIDPAGLDTANAAQPRDAARSSDARRQELHSPACRYAGRRRPGRARRQPPFG
ncbi:type IV secretory system conjugative DNA transfer family protein [uncultured Phenylobacterium sp.]|uniref:type IV secretory system conjugative DNA transfer family protein n=1 Tax=uncultured Phenylobacterium sp. TaxID=349273 RepID=UPI0025E2B47E|nr:type IV secretory system conjugative DNA transfer family protein [uncultured Phenylobacterium sp.]